MAIAMAAGLLVSRSGYCWTSAGPWGGAVRSLVNAPAGGTTLLAGTANGLYAYAGTLPWIQYPETSGLRVLDLAADPERGWVYMIAQLSAEPFSACAPTPVFPGTLYRVSLGTGAMEAMMATEVSSVTICGEGTVLAARNARGMTGTGSVYRFAAGAPHTQTVILPSIPGMSVYWPIYDLLGSAGSSTIHALRNLTSIADALISQNAPACGATWQRSRIAGVEQPYFNKTYHLNGGFLSVLGQDASGNPLLGSSAGSVYAWAGTNWQPRGIVPPAYPVAGFGSDSAGNTIAILRKYNWDVSNGDEQHGGFFYWTGSAWARDARFDTVTGRAAAMIPYPNGTNWETWAAFDEAGIRRIPFGGAAPGEEADEGIAAVSLSGILIDPRQADRALAFGSGGLYERRDGVWRHLVLSAITDAAGNPIEGDTAQTTRERGFLSAAFSPDNPGVLWAGGDSSGLFRAERTAPGSWDYVLKRVYWNTLGGGLVSAVIADPFDSRRLWAGTKGQGVLRSDNEGATWSRISDPLAVMSLANDLLEPPYRTFLAGIAPPGNGTSLLSGDGGGYFGYTSLFLYGSWLESLAFHPLDDSQGRKRALAGPSFMYSGQGMAIVRDGAGAWQYNPSTIDPEFPAECPYPRFNALAMPLGYDGDLAPDAFTAVHSEGSIPSSGVFYSVADTVEGSPGREWQNLDPGGELAPYRPSSVAVHPHDGNLLWVTTLNGSAFTLKGSHVTDTAPPSFPIGYGLAVTGARAGDGIDLFWLAPGDDGDLPGWADRYHLYYRTDSTITGTGDLAGAYSVDMPRPHIAHREETYTLDISAHAMSPYFSIAIRAFDEQGNASALRTAAVDFSSGNQPPVAVDDSPTTLEDTPITMPVLSNDWDTNGNPLSILRTTSPAHGSIRVNADSTINYAPASNYFGTDSFTYTIIDGQGGSDTARVNLTISSVNDRPVAVDDAVTTTEDISYVQVWILANDTDVDPGTVLTASIVSPPAHAQYCSIDDSDRSVLTYTPEANWFGIDTLTYRVMDGAGGSDLGTVVVTVTSVNDPPVAVDDSASTDEDVPVGIAVTANDTDADGDALYVGAISVPPAHGTAVTVSAGTISYGPAANWFGTDGFVYTVRDGKGGSDLGLVTVTVRSVNDPPVVNDKSFIAFFGTPANFPVLSGVTDAEGDTLSLVYAGAPLHGTTEILDPNAGTVRYTPAPSYLGTDSFLYAVSDNHGATGQGRINVTVLYNENRPIAVDDAISTPEDTATTIWALANDLDANIPSLSITGVTAPGHAAAHASTDGKSIAYVPSADYHGPDAFSYTVVNSLMNTDSAVVTVTVASVNDPPVAADDSATAVAGAVSVSVLANDSDPADWDTVSLYGVITEPGYGSAVAQPDGTILYTPVTAFAGTDEFYYRATDNKGGSQIDDAKVTVLVLNTPVDLAPLVQAWNPVLGAASPVRVSFDSGVTAAGKTFCEVTSSGPAPPAGHRAGTPSRYFQVATTAVNGVPVTVSINYSGVAFANEQNIRMFRHDGSAWQEVTGQNYPASYYMDAQTSVLGLFALFEPVSSSGGGGGGGGGCFIATAAYGSPMAPEVDLLRAYRDGYLARRAWGRALLGIYSRFSPPAAGFIADRPAARAAVRTALKPIVACVGEGPDAGAAPALLGIVLALAPSAAAGTVATAAWRRHRRRKSIRRLEKPRNKR